MKAKYISPVCHIRNINILNSILTGSNQPAVQTRQIVSDPLTGGFDYSITTGTGGGWSSLSKNRFYQDDED